MPKAPKFRGARKGRTEDEGFVSALHCTFGSGQGVRAQGGHAGQTVGAGHLISGQRGRGQAGHSPQSSLQAELSIITGSGFGIELFSTYWERSGTGGHSVFSIYWLISGHTIGGGIELFSTYFVKSGIGGQETWPQIVHFWGLPASSNPSRINAGRR